MNYKDFRVEDFLKDEYFVGWVKNPNKESDYFWKNWVEQNPGRKDDLEKAMKVIHSIEKAHHAPTDKEVNEVLEKILNRIDNHDQQLERRAIRLNFFYKAAAVILLVSGFYFVFDNYSRPEQMTHEIGISQIEKSTQKGQKLSFELPDGTRVKLNAESRLVASEDFGKQKRVVTLEGEAFFNVVHDSSRPFIIHTGDLQIQVLGTSFNVNAYQENEMIQVAVESGLVKVQHDGSDETNMLAAGQMLSYYPNDISILVGRFNKLEILGWNNNLIYFKDADFNNIQSTLERWYGIQFTFEKGLLPEKIKESFTGTFQNASLERVLEALNYTSKYQYELKTNNINVKNK